MSIILPEVVGENFTPHWAVDLSNKEYHADKTATNFSSLVEMQKSPHSFLIAHTGKYKRVETGAFRIGTALHMAILQGDLFEKSYVIMPKFAGTGAMGARAEWKKNLSPEAIVLKEDEYADLQEMINSVLKHKDACNVLKHGKTEISGYFRDEQTGIKCRIRPDCYAEDYSTLLDVKSTRSVDINEFSKTIWNYRYDFQIAMYSYGISLITGKKVDYPLFLAIEKQSPFECAVYLADEIMIQKGLIDYQMCMSKLKECMDTQKWSSYQSKIQTISLPTWALKDFEDKI